MYQLTLCLNISNVYIRAQISRLLQTLPLKRRHFQFRKNEGFSILLGHANLI